MGDGSMRLPSRMVSRTGTRVSQRAMRDGTSMCLFWAWTTSAPPRRTRRARPAVVDGHEPVGGSPRLRPQARDIAEARLGGGRQGLAREHVAGRNEGLDLAAEKILQDLLGDPDVLAMNGFRQPVVELPVLG